jgi:hypothetical protein
MSWADDQRTKLLTKDEARRIADNVTKLPGVAASKVIRVPVPMSAFGGKADM